MQWKQRHHMIKGGKGSGDKGTGGVQGRQCLFLFGSVGKVGGEAEERG